MSNKALSDYIVHSKYAHYLPEKKRRETWEEAVDRVFSMHERKYSAALAKSEELREDFEFARDMVKKKRVLGSQRAMQFGGPGIEKHNQKIFNCAFSYADRPRFFQEYFYALLAGSGVGFSVQPRHVGKLPEISIPTNEQKVFCPDDSIEGWADCLGVLLSSYFIEGGSFPEYEGAKVVFDFSKIRPEGSLIAGQFKAPGPKKLGQALEKIRDLLEDAVLFRADRTTGRAKLKPIEVYDICMHASDAVLSGGVRRCLPGDYLVRTGSNEYKQLRDCRPGDQVYFNGEYHKIVNFFEQGEQDLVKIITAEGIHVSTRNHRWLVFNKKDQKLEWRTPNEIIGNESNFAFVKDTR